MTVPAPRPAKTTSAGALRAARLLRALGANAAHVWAEFDAATAAHLGDLIESLPDNKTEDRAAADAFLNERPDTDRSSGVIWAQLSRQPVETLVQLLREEHPQTLALVAARLTPTAAAGLIRTLPRQTALDVLQRLLTSDTPNAAIVSAIENDLAKRLSTTSEEPRDRDTLLAGILDEMQAEAGSDLLAQLNTVDPAASRRIRARMFSFRDIAALPPANLQTLLSRMDRKTLLHALKQADPNVENAILRNMTSRAREILKEDIAALGAVSRSAIADAQADMARLARSLVSAGEIARAGANPDDLIE